MSPFLNDGEPFLARDASAIGLTPYELYEAHREGALRRILDRVFIDPAVPDSRALRVRAMKKLAPPHAVVADDWASWIYGVDTFAPGRRHSLRPQLVVPHGDSRMRISDLDCRQALIPAKDVWEMDGLRVTSPVRTTADFLRKKWRPYALSAADSMAHAGLVSVDEVIGYLAARKGYRGIRQARNLALLITDKADSPGESWTRLRMIDAGFAIPQPQWEIVDRDGNTRFLDLAYPEIMIAVEYDGQEFHTADRDRTHDGYRRKLVRALGFRILVAGFEDIFGDDPAFEQELGRLLGRLPEARRW